MHEVYMKQALTIARYALGRTSPNPLVGAVIVRDGRIVGQGWHRKSGTPHAEVHALRQAGELAAGATIYVTLEPCSHYGRTPPCSQAIIDAGIKKVVVAMTDPNPLVAGTGLKILREAGIEVIEGILTEEAIRLNEVFLKWITTQIPFVVLKTAMTLDGKIATSSGESKWITNDTSRNLVHEMRDIYDSILVGIGTVLADNPSLTTRLEQGGKNPIRIVVDSMAKTPLTAAVIDQSAPTIIAVTDKAPSAKIKALREKGVEIMVVATKNNQVDLHSLFVALGEKKISSVFVEGGATINEMLLKENLVDKVHVFIAPKIIGGKTAPTPIGGQGITALKDACMLKNMTTKIIDGDILITAYVSNKEN